MWFFTMGFLLGCWLFQQSPSIASLHYLWLTAALLFALNRIHFRILLKGLILGLILGLSWSLIYAHLNYPKEIIGLQASATYRVEGQVVSLPQTKRQKQQISSRFLFRASKISLGENSIEGDWLLRVSWRWPMPFDVSDRFVLPLKIKPVHGYKNPGSWDYEAWLYHQGVRYLAYVNSRHKVIPAEASECCLINQVRGYFRTHLKRQLMSENAQSILLALGLGDRSAMAKNLKTLFAKTGTSHLMAISGLHIGLIASFFGFMTMWLWRRIPLLCRSIPSTIAGVSVGLIVAMSYAIISGFGIPAQRALIMLLVAAVALLQRRKFSSVDIYFAAAFFVLLQNPTAATAAGFWLSFVAVAAILVTLLQVSNTSWWYKAIIIQLSITIALYPVIIAFDMQQSFISPLVNLLLVPLFGIFIVPISLLLIVSSPLIADGLWLYPTFGFVIDQIINALNYASQIVSVAPMSQSWGDSLWLLLLLGVIILLSPIGRWAKMVAVVLIIAAHLATQPLLKMGDYRVVVLDVGQGLSVFIETKNHRMLYDTGATYPSGFSLAEAVVLPYLKNQGVSALNQLMLSNGDNDHAGGAEVISQAVHIDKISSGEPHRLKIPTDLCVSGEKWHWDGVDFEILHPAKDSILEGNNASCVLLIDNGAFKTLLPGDVELAAEKLLLEPLRTISPIDLVLVPHHGSATSSSQDFIDVVGADYIVYPLGIDNRYGFPRAEVQQRWDQAGVISSRTDLGGAQEFIFKQNSPFKGPSQYRLNNQRYWSLY